MNHAFNELGLDKSEQTENFINSSQTRHDDDPYSVFKSPGVVNSWKKELDTEIVEKIYLRTESESLSEFLD